MDRRVAFLIGNQTFLPESELPPLRGPLNDIVALADVLGDSERGKFEVLRFADCDSHRIKVALDEHLSSAERGDLVLIHYAGHGKLARTGGLCLATADTRANALYATSIPTSHIRDLVENSPCNSVVLLLDCCYSGAAGTERGDLQSHLQSLQAAASGFYILSASSKFQTAGEVEADHKGKVMGRFTAAIVDGIRTGTADRKRRGEISLSDLVEHVRGAVQHQTPQLFAARASGDPVIALSPDTAKPLIDPGALKDLSSDDWSHRFRGVVKLHGIIRADDAAAADAASRALKRHVPMEQSFEVVRRIEEALRAVGSAAEQGTNAGVVRRTEAQARLDEAEARWRAEAQARLDEAEAKWRTEAQARVDEAEVGREAEGQARLAAEASVERLVGENAQLKAEGQVRVAEVEGKWRAEEQARLNAEGALKERTEENAGLKVQAEAGLRASISTVKWRRKRIVFEACILALIVAGLGYSVPQFIDAEVKARLANAPTAEKVKQAEERAEYAEAKLAAAGKHADDVEAKLAAAGKRADDAEVKRAAAGKRADDAEVKSATAGKRADEAEANLAAVGKRADDAEAKRAAAGKRADDAEAKLAAAGKRADDAEAKLAAAGKRADDAEAKLAAAGRRADDAEAKLAAAGKRADDAEAKRAAAAKRADDAEAKLTAAVKQADDAETKLAAADVEKQARRRAAEDYARSTADNRVQAEAEDEEAKIKLADEDRMRVQFLLTRLGFSPGPIDAKWGGRTRRAIAEWQRSQTYKETGYLTREQVGTLKQQAPAAWANFTEELQQLEKKRKEAEDALKKWQEDNPSQNRQLTYSDKEQYVGEAVGDKRHGRGIMIWPDGEKYDGEFRMDRIQGRGIWIKKDRERYEGDWLDDKINGQGVYTWPSGNRYEGRWFDASFQGYGIFTWASGDRYEGHWDAGVPNRQGTLTKANGKAYVGQWRKGCFSDGNLSVAVFVSLSDCSSQ